MWELFGLMLSVYILWASAMFVLDKLDL